MPLEGRRGGRTSRRRALKPPTITEPTSDLTVFVRAGARGACGPDPRGARPDSHGRVAAQPRCDTSVSIVGRARVGRSHRMQVYALTSTRLRHETLDLFLTREAAEAELQEILEDEPEWVNVLRVVPIELDERELSAN